MSPEALKPCLTRAASAWHRLGQYATGLSNSLLNIVVEYAAEPGDDVRVLVLSLLLLILDSLFVV